eukprot:scaffold24176_cov49-Phaeocystis_antarctica.AAC.7
MVVVRVGGVLLEHGVAVVVGDHELRLEGRLRVLAARLDQLRAEGQVGHELRTGRGTTQKWAAGAERLALTRQAACAVRCGRRGGLALVLGGRVRGWWAHVAVHDVELDPVDAGILEPLALGAHVGPVGGEDLRWDAVVA